MLLSAGAYGRFVDRTLSPSISRTLVLVVAALEHVTMESVFGFHGFIYLLGRDCLAQFVVIVCFELGRFNFLFVYLADNRCIVLVLGIGRHVLSFKFPDAFHQFPLFGAHLVEDRKEGLRLFRGERSFPGDTLFQFRLEFFG